MYFNKSSHYCKLEVIISKRLVLYVHILEIRVSRKRKKKEFAQGIHDIQLKFFPSLEKHSGPKFLSPLVPKAAQPLQSLENTVFSNLPITKKAKRKQDHLCLLKEMKYVF